jgi:aryl-alcohol dehydrogenase-like predicted oxidoreductase
VFRRCEARLKRLGADVIDIYYLQPKGLRTCA